MGMVGKSSSKGARGANLGGRKRRSPTTESHGGSRVEPSKLTQQARDERARKAKARGKKR